MTLKEMFKKIATFNEIATVLGEDRLEIQLSDYVGGVRLASFTEITYKDMVKAVKDEYITEAAEKILNYKEFEWDRDSYIDDMTISVRLVSVR